jgi:hypothetical protein
MCVVWSHTAAIATVALEIKIDVQEWWLRLARNDWRRSKDLPFAASGGLKKIAASRPNLTEPLDLCLVRASLAVYS